MHHSLTSDPANGNRQIDTRGYLAHLFDGIPPDGHYIVALSLKHKHVGTDAPISGNETDTPQSRAFPAGHMDDAAAFLTTFAPDTRDMYVTTHFSRTTDRKGASAADYVRTLYFDDDDGNGPLLANLDGEAMPQPTMVVESSPGRAHVYFRLTRSIPPGRAVNLMKRYVKLAGYDPSKAALGTVLRPPGTLNFKRAKTADEAHRVTGYLTGAPEVDPDELDRVLPPLEGDTAREPGGKGDEAPSIAECVEGYATLKGDWRADADRYVANIVCPFEAEHSEGAGNDSSTSVWQRRNPDGTYGAYVFKCLHAHCADRDWYDFKREVGIPEASGKTLKLGGKDREAAEARPETDDERAERLVREADEVADKCAELRHEPNILDRYVEFQRKAGVVGEADTLKLLYLMLTSRVLSRPVSGAVKGPSSAGKSYLIEKTLKAFPESAYHTFSSMSEKALLYTQKDFRHHFIYIAEMSGVNNDFLEYLLRTLLSEHRLRYETVEKVNGKITPRVVEKDGPTGLIVATTKPMLHPENETRLLSLRVDDSAAHVKAIMRSLATRSRDDADYSEWLALQTWIAGQSNRVIVPYALELVELIPPVDIRINRDVELLLNAIEAHAILHQATRERDEQGRIVATIADYEAVRSIVSDVMSAAVATRVPTQLREVVDAVKSLIDDDKPVSLAAVKRVTGWSKGKAQNWFKTARDEGYIVGENVGRGKKAEYSLGADLPADRDLLPTVEAVAERLTPPEPEANEPRAEPPSEPALNIGEQGRSPAVYPEAPDELVATILADGHNTAAARAAMRRRGVPIPPDVERLCVDVEASATAAGNAEIERQGLEPTVANNAVIDWHAVWAAETRHIITRIEALRQAGHEHAALAIMRRLPAPDEPADDAQVEWAMLNRPFDYRMSERSAYALYAESVTGYPMGAAMVSTGYPLKPRKTESERPM